MKFNACYLLGHNWDLRHVMALLEQLGHTIGLVRCTRCKKLRVVADKKGPS